MDDSTMDYSTMDYMDIATRVLVADGPGLLIALIDDTEDVEDSSNVMSWEQHLDMEHEKENEAEQSDQSMRSGDSEESSSDDGDDGDDDHHHDHHYREEHHEEPPQATILYRCSQCTKTYKTKAVLQQHELDKHMGDVCHYPECEFITEDPMNEDELKQHMLWHRKLDIAERHCDPVVCSWPGCNKIFTRGDTVHRCMKRHNRAEARRTAHELELLPEE